MHVGVDATPPLEICRPADIASHVSTGQAGLVVETGTRFAIVPDAPSRARLGAIV